MLDLKVFFGHVACIQLHIFLPTLWTRRHALIRDRVDETEVPTSLAGHILLVL